MVDRLLPESVLITVSTTIAAFYVCVLCVLLHSSLGRIDSLQVYLTSQLVIFKVPPRGKLSMTNHTHTCSDFPSVSVLRKCRRQRNFWSPAEFWYEQLQCLFLQCYVCGYAKLPVVNIETEMWLFPRETLIHCNIARSESHLSLLHKTRSIHLIRRWRSYWREIIIALTYILLSPFLW